MKCFYFWFPLPNWSHLCVCPFWALLTFLVVSWCYKFSQILMWLAQMGLDIPLVLSMAVTILFFCSSWVQDHIEEFYYLQKPCLLMLGPHTSYPSHNVPQWGIWVLYWKVALDFHLKGNAKLDVLQLYLLSVAIVFIGFALLVLFNWYINGICSLGLS